MQMSDSYIEIDGGEVVDISSNATTPEALRRAAAYLRQQSEKPPDLRFARFAQPETKPSPPSLAEQIGHRRIDEPYDEAEASARRFNQARAQIEVALMKEQEQAEQQQNQTRKQARNTVAGSPLGRLMKVPYER
jgi:hypothetical protein